MIIVTGARGQLGTDVVLELKSRNIEHIGIDVADLDITDSKAVDAFFKELSERCNHSGEISSQEISRTDIFGTKISVVHCAAYTAVDKAEDEPELCLKVNAEGTRNLAKACRQIDAEMLYLSTDYVFDGTGSDPYETDATQKNPASTYGKSKLEGEKAVTELLDKYYIVRISWVFGAAGANFVKTMLRLAETKTEINVVSDQIGSPTYTPDLAVLLCDMALSKKYGIYHATNEGYCSWAEFAEEIMRASAKDDPQKAVKINHITTEQYPTKAKRPKNSRLSKKSLDDAGFSRLPPWQDALRRYLRAPSESLSDRVLEVPCD